MKKEDIELFERDEKVHVDWMQIGIEVLITLAFILFVAFACVCASSAKERIEPPVAGVNKALMDMLHTPVYPTDRWEEVETDEEDFYEDRLVELFGYVPSDDEITLLKRVAMAESGNTEPIEGIAGVMMVIANRCRLTNYPGYSFPNTITEVVTQRGQFQTYSNGAIWKYEINSKVEEAWDGLISGDYDYYNTAYAFTAGYYNPYFTQLYKVGNHYFGGLKCL